MKDFFTSFLDLFFPSTCVYSGDKILFNRDLPISFSSEAQLVPSRNDDLINPELEQKFKGLFPYKYLLSSFIFSEGGVCQSLVHQAKYKGQTHIFEHYAGVISNEIKERFSNSIPDVIIPVPNHWYKRFKKGFNQAEILSHGLSKGMKISHEPMGLRKRADFSSQTKNNKLNRLKRLKTLYKVKKSQSIHGKHVLLVDDVVTSGATIETCANHLLKAGAKQVSIYCFAVVK